MAGQVEELAPALPEDILDLAVRILDRAHDKDKRLATAESCTGGLLAALLTDVPGRGKVFDRGFVAYSDQAKCDLLGVDRALVDDCGAVSPEVAEAMAAGAQRRSQADLAVSITGFAGPGGECDEEGLVYFALLSAEGQKIDREEHFGSIGRDGVRLAALRVALKIFDQALAS